MKAKKLRKKVKEIMIKNGKSLDGLKYYYKQAKKLARLGLVVLFLMIHTTSFADMVSIPFSCYPKKMQASFEKRGYKLDLDGNDRTEDSWGFIVNKGNKFEVYTYKPITVEELEMLREVTWETR